MTHPRRTISRAFTLVELLVVIAILAVLLALLAPTLRNAMNQARTTVCKSQLKNLGTAQMQYANMFDSYYPICFYGVQSGGNWVSANAPWVEGHNPGGNNPWSIPTWDVCLLSVLPGVEVFGCPVDEVGSITWGGYKTRDGMEIPWKAGRRSYSILVSGFFWGSVNLTDGGIAGKGASRRITEVEDATGTIMLGEHHTRHQHLAHYSGSAMYNATDKFFYAERAEGGFAAHHGDAGERRNFLMCDGHVETANYNDTIGEESGGTLSKPKGWWTRQAGD